MGNVNQNDSDSDNRTNRKRKESSEARENFWDSRIYIRHRDLHVNLAQAVTANIGTYRRKINLPVSLTLLAIRKKI